MVWYKGPGWWWSSHLGVVIHKLLYSIWHCSKTAIPGAVHQLGPAASSRSRSLWRTQQEFEMLNVRMEGRLTTTFCHDFSESFRLTDNLGKCNGQFLQQWFCSVRSPCITEVMYHSHPEHRAETELLWTFGVSTCSICKVILKLSSVT